MIKEEVAKACYGTGIKKAGLPASGWKMSKSSMFEQE